MEGVIDFKSNSTDYLTTPTGERELSEKKTHISRASMSRSVAKSKNRLQFKQNKLLE
jgi:hypothetical protein